jgi:hypothetical protein
MRAHKREASEYKAKAACPCEAREHTELWVWRVAMRRVGLLDTQKAHVHEACV